MKLPSTLVASLVVPALAVLALAGCQGPASGDPAPTLSPDDEVTLEVHEYGKWTTAGGSNGWSGDDDPFADSIFDYQLGGGYESEAQIVARDRTDPPGGGYLSICYINGFQTQPGEAELWLNEHPTVILRDSSGEPVVDENWPDEMILDTSTPEKRDEILATMTPWIQGCAIDGFSAVEFDNLDSYLRSGGALSPDDNQDFATMLATVASSFGLHVGQKNSVELVDLAPTIGFDFAVSEECHRWNECAAYTAAFGPRVLNIEYTDDLRGSIADICSDPSTPAHTIIRDRNLTTPDNPDYFFEAC